MTALPLIRSDADWQRMSWRAKQQWLAAADKLRHEMAASMERDADRERRRRIIAEHSMAAGIDPGHYDVTRSLDLAREIRSHLPDDPHGADHLAALDPRVGDGAKADAYRARNAARQRTLRAERRAS